MNALFSLALFGCAGSEEPIGAGELAIASQVAPVAQCGATPLDFAESAGSWTIDVATSATCGPDSYALTLSDRVWTTSVCVATTEDGFLQVDDQEAYTPKYLWFGGGGDEIERVMITVGSQQPGFGMVWFADDSEVFPGECYHFAFLNEAR